MKNITTIEAKFRRSKITATYTKLWSEVDGLKQANLLAAINLKLAERPIVYFFKSALDNWWLLTDQRLIIYNNRILADYDLEEIKKVDMKDLFEGISQKNECTTLQLMIEDRYIDLPLESNTWPLIYELLRFIIEK